MDTADAAELFGDDAPVLRYDADTSDDEDDLRPEDSISRRGDPIPDDPDQTANPSEESQLNETAQTQPKEGEASQTTEVKKKRIIRNPQPKLDAARITGNRGVGALEEIFKNFKPKGKGHEFNDLDIALKKMEHWAHRLYPKLPFEDVTDRIAELGKKKAVSNYVKRVRVGMEVYAEHIQDPKDQDREEEEEEVDNVARMGDPEDREKENDALFDSIVDRYQSAKASETGGDGTGDKAADAFPEDDEDEELFSQAIAQSQY